MYGLPDFTVGGALRQTWIILRRHAGPLFAAGFLLYALPVAALGAVALVLHLPDANSFQVAAARGEPSPDLGIFLGYLGVNALVQIGCYVVAAAVAIRVAHDGLYGRPAGFGGQVGAALRCLLPAAAMVVLSGLAVGAASLLLIVPGIMLFCRWSAALPALVVEGAGVLGSLGRSRDLTRHHRWAILGFYVVFGLILTVLFIALGVGVAFLSRSMVADLGLTAARWILTAVNGVFNALVVMLNGASAAALYFELRRASEGVLSSEAAAAFA